MMLCDAHGNPISVRASEGLVHVETRIDTLTIRAEDMADFCSELLRTADWVIANDPGGAA